MMIVQAYSRKFQKVDQVFATDVVGDGTNHVVGPFETAQGRFYKGQVVPLSARGGLGS